MVEFNCHFKIHHEKCIQISTNMPGIGPVICKLRFKMLRFLRKPTLYCNVKLEIGRMQSVKKHCLKDYLCLGCYMSLET